MFFSDYVRRVCERLGVVFYGRSSIRPETINTVASCLATSSVMKADGLDGWLVHLIHRSLLSRVGKAATVTLRNHKVSHGQVLPIDTLRHINQAKNKNLRALIASILPLILCLLAFVIHVVVVFAFFLFNAITLAMIAPLFFVLPTQSNGSPNRAGDRIRVLLIYSVSFIVSDIFVQHCLHLIMMPTGPLGSLVTFLTITFISLMCIALSIVWNNIAAKLSSHSIDPNLIASPQCEVPIPSPFNDVTVLSLCEFVCDAMAARVADFAKRLFDALSGQVSLNRGGGGAAGSILTAGTVPNPVGEVVADVMSKARRLATDAQDRVNPAIMAAALNRQLAYAKEKAAASARLKQMSSGSTLHRHADQDSSTQPSADVAGRGGAQVSQPLKTKGSRVAVMAQ